MTGDAHSGTPAGTPAGTPDRFARAAWLVLAYTLAVIVFGAWVRITGSGAGCGQHWPTCHGEVVHRPQSIETVIELTHRVTSGLSLVFVGGLMVWARKRFAPSHPARVGATLAFAFVIIEALLGAGLVMFGLVEDDDSVARAVVMAVHLTNTCILMGALAAAAWTSGTSGTGGTGGAKGRPRRPRLRASTALWTLVGGLILILCVSMSGAVTALGDTLYPLGADGSVVEHLVDDQSISANFLQRMRVVHPILAVVAGLYLLWVAVALPGVQLDGAGPELRRLANVVAGLVVAQLCAGVVNIMLSAPGWMQLVHLTLATALWTAVVVLALAVLSAAPQR